MPVIDVLLFTVTYFLLVVYLSGGFHFWRKWERPRCLFYFLGKKQQDTTDCNEKQIAGRECLALLFCTMINYRQAQSLKSRLFYCARPLRPIHNSHQLSFHHPQEPLSWKLKDCNFIHNEQRQHYNWYMPSSSYYETKGGKSPGGYLGQLEFEWPTLHLQVT